MLAKQLRGANGRIRMARRRGERSYPKIATEVNLRELRRKAAVALLRRGVRRGNGIDWQVPEVATICLRRRVNPLGESGIWIVRDDESDAQSWGYAGFHAVTKTYWRLKTEGINGGGKYCMRIIRVMDSV